MTDSTIDLLDRVAHEPRVREGVRNILDRVTRALKAGRETMAWETVPLSTFGSSLPSQIASCWIFVIRQGADTGAERHPNSHQRSLSLAGQGEFQLWNGDEWKPHVLMSGPTDDVRARWVSIPPLTWHRLFVGPSPWGMLSFHTVPATELIEEKPASPDDLTGPTVKHRYQE